MDKKLAIIGIVTGVLALGGLGYAVVRGAGTPTAIEAPDQEPDYANELPADAGADTTSDTPIPGSTE